MKKKILALVGIVALLSVLVMPTAVLADTTGVTGQVAETPTVESVTPSSVTPNSAGVSADTEVTIVGTNFVVGLEAQTTITFTDTTGITASDLAVVDATHITATFATATLADAGARNVYVTVAGKTSTDEVTFTVVAFITVGAPSAIDLGYMTAGTTVTGTSTAAGTVVSNYATDWSVAAIDEKVGDPVATGYMTIDGTGGTKLAEKFEMNNTEGDYTDADVALNYTTKPATLPFYVSQVVAADATAGAYTITITFTGSGS